MPRLAALARVALSFAIASAAAAACDVANVAPPSDGADGVDSGSLDRATCPEAEPVPGASCGLPEGTTCAFGSCAARIAQCTRGTWIFAGNPPFRTACPKDKPPAQDDPCPCVDPAAECVYTSESCSDPDAAGPPNTAVATCPHGTWQLRITACRDAGADVQGDVGPDAS